VNALDWILVVVVLAYAVSGYWQGFITGAFATAGLLCGGAFGIWLAPHLLGNADPSVFVTLGALFIVVLAATIGQATFQFVGARVRDRIRWRPVRFVDAVGGAALSAAAVLVIAWALGVAVSGTHVAGLTGLVRDSTVLAKVNAVMPARAGRLLGSFDDVVGASFFPRYLEPFEPEHIVAVGPGPQRLRHDADVLRSGHSVVKVHGAAVCGRGVEGSGFVVRHDYVLTNAHVVAGVQHPDVVIGDQNVAATVVAYDPETDLALLRVDTGRLAVLPFDTSAQANDPVAILGYPEDGPFDLEPGRIRAEQRLRSPDIYGNGNVIRDVFSLRGLIRPGNSGGPIVESDGKVAGLVFAASVTDKDTGYALTASQVMDFVRAGVGRTAAVSTQGCSD